jgi:hypothetical protein
MNFWLRVVGMGFDLDRESRDWRHKARDTREFIETNYIVLHSAGKFMNHLRDVLSISAQWFES